MKLICCLLLCAPMLVRGADDTAHFPVVDNDRQAVIVGQGRSLHLAIQQSTGVSLQVVRENQFKPGKDMFPIYVGNTKTGREILADQISTLDAEGYILHVEAGRAFIYAPPNTTDTGDPIHWAIGDFLARFLGVLYLMPGELGIHIPRHDRIVIPTGTWIEQPAFKHRHWSGYGGKAGATWRVRASGGGGRYKFHHNLFRIIDPKAFADRPAFFPVIRVSEDQKLHPFYNNLKVGERYIPKPQNKAAYWQPCTSNPDVIEHVANSAIQYFDTHPKNRSFSLGVNDSGGYCHCEQCLAQTPQGIDPLSDQADGYRFYRFYNQVAERVALKHDDVRLGFLVYGNLTDWYPEKLHPLLMPYLTMSMADRWDESFRQKQNQRIARWSKIASQFGIYEWLHGEGFIIPRIYLHHFADGLKHAHACGAEGFYAEAYPNWGLDGPKLWVTEQLLWNPNQDVNQLIDHWHAAMFAEAAKPMRAYFDYLEQAWATQAASDNRRGGYRLYGAHMKDRQLTEVFPPATCESAWKLLQKAQRIAHQPIVKQRIAYFKTAFGATRVASSRLASARSLEVTLKQSRKRKVDVSLNDWLKPLDVWVQAGSLNAYMDEARVAAPYAFHAFSYEQIAKGKKASFAAWDSDAPVINRVIGKMIEQLMNPDSGQAPGSKHELDQAADKLITKLPISDALADTLKSHLHQSTISIKSLDTAPAIDGTIESAWGKPSFDGRFYAYPYQDQPDDKKTAVWCAQHDGKLYFAFRCEQDRKTIKADTTIQRDQTPLRDDGVINPPDAHRPSPFIQNADSVGILLPGRQYATVIVNAGGAVLDCYATSRGYRPDWNGATAAVHIDESSWSVELIIDPFEPLAGDQPIRGINFFRFRGYKRSAWVPGQPRVWSIQPASSGYVFLEEPAGAPPSLKSSQ